MDQLPIMWIQKEFKEALQMLVPFFCAQEKQTAHIIDHNLNCRSSQKTAEYPICFLVIPP